MSETERDSRGITFHLEAGDLFLKFDEVELFLIYPERCTYCGHLVIFHSKDDCIIGSCRCNIMKLQLNPPPFFTGAYHVC